METLPRGKQMFFHQVLRYGRTKEQKCFLCHQRITIKKRICCSFSSACFLDSRLHENPVVHNPNKNPWAAVRNTLHPLQMSKCKWLKGFGHIWVLHSLSPTRRADHTVSRLNYLKPFAVLFELQMFVLGAAHVEVLAADFTASATYFSLGQEQQVPGGTSSIKEPMFTEKTLIMTHSARLFLLFPKTS